MKARITILVLAAASLQAAAAPKHKQVYYPFVTFDAFVAGYQGTPQVGVTQPQAQGYSAAVADLSQNRTWCPPRGSDPGRIEAEAVAALAAKLPELGKQPGKPLMIAAAPYLLAEYTARYRSKGDACPFTARLTGEAFAKDVTGELEPGGTNTRLEQSAEAATREIYAKGYLLGVADASQARSACPPLRLKPVEVLSYAMGDLRDRKAQGPLPENAAVLLAELLTARFPCKR